MSRSFKKNPFTVVTCSESNKKDKTIANRLFRRKNKINMKKGDELLYSLKEVSDTWDFESDGLAYYITKDDLKNSSRTDEEVNEIYRKILQK